jgi:hypothetical protein
LDPASARALCPCTAYAVLRTRGNGQGRVDDVMLTKFLREGWEEVEGNVETNVDAAFNTEWIALRKSISAGPVVLQLDTINFGRAAAVFAFKGQATTAKSDAPVAVPTPKPTSRSKALFRSDIVEFTDKASPNWIFKEAKVGTDVWSDKGYFFSIVPKEMEGGSLVVRGSGQQQQWLPPATITAIQDCSAYVMLRTKYLGKEELGESTFVKLANEGWKEVDEKASVTFPNGENWQWKVFKKAVSKGPIDLSLQTVSWGRHHALFIFKQP